VPARQRGQQLYPHAIVDDHTVALMIALRDAARPMNGVVEGLGMGGEPGSPDISSSDLDRLNGGMPEAMFSWGARVHRWRRGPAESSENLALVTE
jgi:hypothetical protein